MRKPTIWQKLNPIWGLFGNDDDGLYGDDVWRAGRAKTLWLAVQWWLRNPFHNFTHYVIGVADRAHVYHGRDMDVQGLILAYVECSFLRLPFVAFNWRGLFSYIGWRPSGAFGIKLIYRKPV